MLRLDRVCHMICVSGIMRPDELSMFQRLDHKVSANKWFLPLIWTSDILKLGLEEGRLRPQCVTSMLLEAGIVTGSLNYP